MKPQKAWVVSVHANFQERAIAVLSPYWGVPRVKAYVDGLFDVMSLTLEEQLATFRRKNPLTRNKSNVDGGSLITVLGESGQMIAAQRAVVRDVTEIGGKQWLRFQPDSFKRWRLDPKTQQPQVVEEVEPPELVYLAIDLRLSVLLPKV